MVNGRRAAFVCAGTIIVAVAGILAVGSLLSAPVQRTVGPPPPELRVESVSFPSGSGAEISAWFGKPRPEGPVVVLSHGVRGARDQLADRALLLRKAGYGILLYDAQGHGESSGDFTTFGYLESRDARAAVSFVRDREPKSSIGFIGPSLAGASALLGSDSLPVDALVLEAVYPTLARAVENRIEIRLGSFLAKPLASLLLWQVEPRLGFDPYALNPIDMIGKACAPILIIAGAEDRHTTISESKALFEAAPEPKELWVVEGAAHQSFYKFAGTEYEARLLEFLGRFLKTPRRITRRCSLTGS